MWVRRVYHELCFHALGIHGALKGDGDGRGACYIYRWGLYRNERMRRLVGSQVYVVPDRSGHRYTNHTNEQRYPHPIEVL
jgi:hypothetical protein